jgi:hypothetical protein
MMAHWAKLDENNIVIEVTVGNNNDVDEGYSWLMENIGGTWVKTSYNSYGGKHYQEIEEQIQVGQGVFKTVKNRVESGQPHLRYNFASIGYYYDSEKDAFIPPKPYNSWILNEETCLWEPPTPYPTDGGRYIWVEEDLNWQAIEE